jgi:hypothetical protein
MLPSDENLVQNPTVTFAIVEQNEIPKGHCFVVRLVLLAFCNDTFKVRQLSAEVVCDSKAEKLLINIEPEVIATVKGLVQGAQETKTEPLADVRVKRTAMLSMPVKLQFTNEFLANKRNILGNDMTKADSYDC